MINPVAPGVDVKFESMPVETRWLLRGIQLGMALASEFDQSKREELIRCGLYEASNPGPNSGDNGPH